MPDYLVVLKADANARFRRPEHSMTFNAVVEGVNQRVTFRTRFTDEGLEAQVPRELMAECRTVADNIDTAIVNLGTFASGLANLTAFVTNAAVSTPTLYVAMDATPGLTGRDFREEFGQFDNGPIQQGRAIPIDEVGAVAALMGAAKHLEAGWSVAAQHYALALTRWRLGSEPFVLTHLYTASEALSKTIVLQEADRLGVTTDDLLPNANKTGTWAYYRRKVVYQGDDAFMKEVQVVSDNIEHGSISVAEAQAHSSALAPRLFRLIRECMLSLIEAPDELRDVLLGERYGQPLDPTLRRVVHGEMNNLPDADAMGPDGSAYPFLTWNSGLLSLAYDDEGELQAGQMAEKFTVHTADGGGFRLTGLRWYGRRTDPTKPPVDMKDVTVTFGSGDQKPDAEGE